MLLSDKKACITRESMITFLRDLVSLKPLKNKTEDPYTNILRYTLLKIKENSWNIHGYFSFHKRFLFWEKKFFR